MRGITLGALLLSAILLPAASYATPSYYLVTTSQATANTQLDIDHSRTWFFSPTENFELGGGSFKIKEGPATTLDAILTLYTGANMDQVGSPVHVSATVVSQSYQYAAFLFSTPILLTAGNNYTLSLTSLTGDQGSQQYFIKGGSNAGDFGFYQSYPTGNDPAPAPTTDGPASPTFGATGAGSAAAVPEPTTCVLVGSALIAAARFRRKRS